MTESRGFETIERQLAGILDHLSDLLSEAEREEVVHFVDVGEYGLALETLGALLIEERKHLPQSVFEEIVALSDVMGIREAVVTDALRAQVVVGSNGSVPPSGADG